MPDSYPYTQLGPVAFANVTTAERMLLDQHPGLTVRDSDLGVLMISDGIQWTEYITRIQMADMFDAVIDAGYSGTLAGVYRTILEAADDLAISVFVRSADDIVPFTITAAHLLQRLQGKDADTTTLPVAMTVNKDDVTIEQLSIAGALSGSGLRLRVNDCLLAPAGSINISGIVSRLRAFLPQTATPITADIVLDSLITIGALAGATNAITLKAAGAALIRGLQVDGAHITTPDYVIKGTFGGRSIIIADCDFLDVIGGGISIDFSTFNSELTIDNVNIVIDSGGPLAAGKKGINLTSTAGDSVRARISGGLYRGFDGTDVMLEYDDVVTGNISLEGVHFVACTIKGWTGARWTDVSARSCTINFQSKTGMQVEGGDMTGAVLQNVPADLKIWNVKGIPQKAHVYHNAAQAIPTGVATILAFNSERYDDGGANVNGVTYAGMHDTVTNNSRITCVIPGTYRIEAHIVWAASAVGVQRQIALLVNNAAAWDSKVVAPTAVATYMTAAVELQLVPGDYVEVQVTQDSGGNLNIAGIAGLQPEFWMTRVGP